MNVISPYQLEKLGSHVTSNPAPRILVPMSLIGTLIVLAIAGPRPLAAQQSGGGLPALADRVTKLEQLVVTLQTTNTSQSARSPRG